MKIVQTIVPRPVPFLQLEVACKWRRGMDSATQHVLRLRQGRDRYPLPSGLATQSKNNVKTVRHQGYICRSTEGMLLRNI